MSSKKGLSLREMLIFAMLGGLMFCSKLVMELAPNVHLLGMFIVSFTLVYRAKALIPIYIFVLLSGLYYGFSLWWFPYLYIWTVLWGAVMLLPKKLPQKLAPLIYMGIAGFHGLCFGTLYAPFQALAFGMSFRVTLSWIIAGLPWDALHALGNVAGGVLIVPLKNLLLRLEKSK